LLTHYFVVAVDVGDVFALVIQIFFYTFGSVK